MPKKKASKRKGSESKATKRSSAKRRSSKRKTTERTALGRTPRKSLKRSRTKTAAKRKQVGVSRRRVRSGARQRTAAPRIKSASRVAISPPDKAAAEAPELRQLEFSLQPGAPEMVRVTLGPKELVLLNDQSWPSNPRLRGAEVRANIELIGNPGQTATINVVNAMPAVISAKIPDGQTHHAAPKTLYAEWK
jgi:hypothetical protein